MSREQELLLEELATFVNLVDGKPHATHHTADAKQWTMHELMQNIFPVRLLLCLSPSIGWSAAFCHCKHLACAIPSCDICGSAHRRLLQ